MEKYIPKYIKELYQNVNLRGKIVLLYNTEYAEDGSLIDYEIYKTYDDLTSEARRDWVQLCKKKGLQTPEEIEENVRFILVPRDIERMTYM